MDGLVAEKVNSLLEFRHQERRALSPPPLVPHGVLNSDLVKDGTIIQLDGDGISDRPFSWIVVLRRVGSILDTGDLRAKSIDSWISGSGISAG